MAVPRFLHPYARPARERFITIVRGEGARVYDADGREYVDAMASLWYMNVGYGRDEIVNAAAAQMRRLPAYNSFDPFTNEPAEQLAARLADLSPIDEQPPLGVLLRLIRLRSSRNPRASIQKYSDAPLA